MISWLASYPKSGNTWARLFLDAYALDAEPDINRIRSTRADQYKPMYKAAGIDVDDYDMEQWPLGRGAMLLRMDKAFGKGFIAEGFTLPLIVKTHSANCTVNGIRQIPNVITKRVVLLVRDPRNVVKSYARHLGRSIDEAIDVMLDDRQASYDEDSDRLPQNMMSWSSHVRSYATSQTLDVWGIKYEEMRRDPVKNFSHILKAFEIPVDEDRVLRAVERCELSQLKSQEKSIGFREASKNCDGAFFGGSDEIVLTDAQRQRIEDGCRDMMVAFGYLQAEQAKEAA